MVMMGVVGEIKREIEREIWGARKVDPVGEAGEMGGKTR